MSNPFDLNDPDAYRVWRDNKLKGYPGSAENLRVEIGRPEELTRGETERIQSLVSKTSTALFACRHSKTMDKTALLAFGRQLGLSRLDNHLCADEAAVSTLTPRTAGQASDYIPYSNRPLSWHSDGYYNPPDRQIGAWMLYCIRDAVKGGENALLDHEIAYIRLRDRDPALIRALMDPQAMCVPANVEKGILLRPASIGPVFSIRAGSLHMRYSARVRHIAWKQTPEVEAARTALLRLFSSDDVYIFRHKLTPGEGYVSNNPLHNRSGFEIPKTGGAARVLLRARYLDRVYRRSGLGA